MKYILSAIAAVFTLTACHTTGTSDHHDHATCPHGAGADCCAKGNHKKGDACCDTTATKKKKS